MGNKGELKDKYFTDFIYLFLIFAVNIIYYSYFINKLPDFYADDYYIFAAVKNYISSGIYILPNEVNYLFWRPVLFFSFCLDYIIAGNNPILIKYISLFFHLLVIISVYYTTIKLLNIFKVKWSKYYIFLIVLAFSLHTVNYKCIFWISQKNALIMELFFITSFYCIFRYFESGKNKFLVYSFIAFIISLFAKQNAASLPIIASILYVIFRKYIFSSHKSHLVKLLITMFFIEIFYGLGISLYFKDLNILFFLENIYKKPFVIISPVLYFIFPYKFSATYYFFVDNYLITIILLISGFLFVFFVIFYSKKYNLYYIYISVILLSASFFPQILISNEFRNLNIQILILLLITSIILLNKYKNFLFLFLFFLIVLYPLATFQEAKKDIKIIEKNNTSILSLTVLNQEYLKNSTLICSIEEPGNLPYKYYYMMHNDFRKIFDIEYLRIILLIREDKIVSSNLNTEMIRVTKNNDTLTFSTVQDFVEFSVYKDVPVFNIKKSPFSRGYKEFQYALTPDLKQKNLIYYNGISWESVK